MWTCEWSILSQGGLGGLGPLYQVASALPDPQHITTREPQLPRLGEWRSVTTPFFIIKEYPLYQLGGPQLRVFRTNFFIQLVRPGTVQPEDTVQFRIPMEMTRVDLRNYLERIYNVPVAAVRTRVQHGSNRKRDHRNVRIKKPDYKVAYVQLAHGQTFTFPDLFPEREQSPAGGPVEEGPSGFPEAQKPSSHPRQGGIPNWFSL
ncbi:39S ribosomal protein L23, mitochondrial isoform X1 [Marmota marmota marmota]|uniref:39S ribosomal protein L23, mitochondrial isoform X1 n=1 Tax=Marmota marmota marmota TaxID=9994 RepID=UPI0020934CB8|nr:39S ribosomal protein L23, mitochondrial isoform X1 [Marmota marmota marmota]